MFCAQCGLDIDDDSRFCRHCGAAQRLADPAAPDRIEPTFPAYGTPAPRSGGGTSAAWIVAGVAGVGLLIAVVTDSGGPATTPDNAMTTDLSIANDTMAMAGPAPAASPSAVAENWTYSSDEDRVRGATSYYARTTSTNSIRQNAPYDGDTTMTITVRRSPGFGLDVFLTVSSGQLMCPSYEGCSGTVRFDQGPARRISFNGPADNSSDTIFVANAASFIASLKRAKKVVIEKTMYEAGAPQFEFDLAGLRWQH